MTDPTTEELRVKQLKREIEEKERAEQAQLADESDTHDRRAMKAEYLRAKLEQRAESERQAAEEEGDR
jgi:hypothetical protein